MRKIKDADYAHLWRAYGNGAVGAERERIRNELVTAYYPLVRYIAERLVSTLPASVDVDDLASLGTFGLLEAIDRFEVDKGFQFKTYATARIRGSILDGLRTADWVPRLVRLRVNLVDKTRARLAAGLGRVPTAQEMAEELGMSLDAYSALVDEASPISMLSLTDETSDDPEGGSRMIDLVRDKKGEDPAPLLEEKEFAGYLFSLLRPAEQVVCMLYYFDERSMREIAQELRLTESRVCQIHAKALKRIQRLFGLEDP